MFLLQIAQAMSKEVVISREQEVSVISRPTIVHKGCFDWKLFSIFTAKGDIDAEAKSRFQCLRPTTHVSLAKLRASHSYELHMHKDREEVHYTIRRRGCQNWRRRESPS